MTSSTADSRSPTHAVAAGSSTVADTGPLRELQQKLLRAVTGNHNKRDTISAIARTVVEATEPSLMVYLERHGESWNDRLVHSSSEGHSPELRQQLLTWSNDACRHGTVQINAIDLPQGGGIAVTAPILLKGSPPDALATVYHQSGQSVDQIVVVHQLIAAHVALWQVLGQARQAEVEAQATASLIELLANLEASENLEEAGIRLVNELHEHLNCQQVVLGLCSRGTTHCRLVAVSGTARFDKRAEHIRMMEAVLDEALVRNELTIWPATDDGQRQGGLAHDKLLITTAAECLVSSPLRDDNETIVGAWFFLGEQDLRNSEVNLNFIEACERPIGSTLRLFQQAQRGVLSKTASTLLAGSRLRRRLLAGAAIVLTASLLAVPFPYKVRCACTVEPVVRRVVVAPYDGILKQSRVEPGTIVAQDELLAEMDGREIKWELAGLEAEFNRARKERDATLAEDKVAAAQRAKLEMQRLELKQQLLRHRGENLEIRSPLEGIVISGDLEKVEGAPLKIGESLFEIAPLDRLLVEIAIEDREINYVREGAEVEVRLEAYPWRKWRGQIANIFPRSEIRDDRNVFVAEVPLDNTDRQLRPGMKGRATIISAPRPLVWNLFHKPCETLLLWLGW